MNALKKKLNKNGGFTLVEMLIVVAIIAILIAVSIPLVNSALEKSRDATDQANERSAKAEAAIVYLGVSEFGELNFATGKGGVDFSDNGTWDSASKVFTFYYNAVDGKLQPSNAVTADSTTIVAAFNANANKYGKCTYDHEGEGANAPTFAAVDEDGDADTGEHEDKFLKVKIDEDGNTTLEWTDTAS